MRFALLVAQSRFVEKLYFFDTATTIYLIYNTVIVVKSFGERTTVSV